LSLSNQLSQEQIKLVADTVKTIAKHRGYLNYPKETEVKLVLEATTLIVRASKLLEEQHGVKQCGTGDKPK